MRHRKHVRPGPLQITCRSEAVFPPDPGPVNDSMRHTCVTATDLRQRHEDHDHNYGHSLLGATRAAHGGANRGHPPQSLRNRQADARTPLIGRHQIRGAYGKAGAQTQRDAAAPNPPQGRRHHAPVPPGARRPHPLHPYDASASPTEDPDSHFAIAIRSQRCGTPTNGTPASARAR